LPPLSNRNAGGIVKIVPCCRCHRWRRNYTASPAMVFTTQFAPLNLSLANGIIIHVRHINIAAMSTVIPLGPLNRASLLVPSALRNSRPARRWCLRSSSFRRRKHANGAVCHSSVYIEIAAPWQYRKDGETGCAIDAIGAAGFPASPGDGAHHPVRVRTASACEWCGCRVRHIEIAAAIHVMHRDR